MNPMMADAAALSAIIGYTAMITARLPERWKKHAVFISCAIGVVYALTIRPVQKKDIVQTIIEGTMTGLAASGGYAGMKASATPTT